VWVHSTVSVRFALLPSLDITWAYHGFQVACSG
jgi:hypothetical protein